MFFSYRRLIGYYFLKTSAYSTHSSPCHISLICWRLHCCVFFGVFFFCPPWSCERRWDREAVNRNITCPVPDAPTAERPLRHKAAVMFAWLRKNAPKQRRQRHRASKPGRTIRRPRNWQQCSIIESVQLAPPPHAVVYINVSTWYCALSFARIINSITPHLGGASAYLRDSLPSRSVSVWYSKLIAVWSLLWI